MTYMFEKTFYNNGKLLKYTDNFIENLIGKFNR